MLKYLKCTEILAKLAFAAHFEFLRCSIEWIPVVETESSTVGVIKEKGLYLWSF